MAEMTTDSGVPLSPAMMKVQQDAIDRQRKIAEYLQQQSFTPDQGQMVSGHYVAPGVASYLSKIAQGLLGSKQQSDLDKKQLGIVNANDLAEERAFGINRNAPQAVSSNGAPEIKQALADGASQGNVGPTNANMMRVSQLLQDKQSPIQELPQSGGRTLTGMSPYEALSAMRRDPKSYETAYLKQFEPTELMRNNKYAGITPEQYAAAERAKMSKAGMLEMQPGNTVKNLATGGYEVAPDFKTGIVGGFDANGQPTMSKIGGSGTLAEIAGDIKRAEAGGAAGYKMVTADVNGVPTLMTEEQAAKLASGVPHAVNANGQQGAGFPRNDTKKMDGDFASMTHAILANPESSDADKADAQQWLDKHPEYQQPSVGIPQRTEAQKEREVGTERMKLAVEEKRLKDLGEITAKSGKLYEQIKAAVPLAREYLKEATGSGVGAVADKALNVIGKSTKSGEAAAQLDTLAGWMTSNIPRMEGPQSDKDTLLYRQMAAQVGDRTAPNATRLKALDTLESLQNKYAEISGVSKKSNVTTGSNIDDLLKKYGGK